MSIEIIRPACSICYDACPCRHFEHIRILNELTQAQARIVELESNYSAMVLSLSKQVEIDR